MHNHIGLTMYVVWCEKCAIAGGQTHQIPDLWIKISFCFNIYGNFGADNMTRFHIVIITKSAMISQLDASIVIASFAWHFHINRPFIGWNHFDKTASQTESFRQVPCFAMPLQVNLLPHFDLKIGLFKSTKFAVLYKYSPENWLHA